MRATHAFPLFRVLSYETALPVNVVLWHVRSVRPIREMTDDNETLTRIEFDNGDCLDTSDTVAHVLEQMSGALKPVPDAGAGAPEIGASRQRPVRVRPTSARRAGRR